MEMYVTENCPRCGNAFTYTRMMKRDVCYTCECLNSMVFWFPRLQDLGIPTPRTIFVHLDSPNRRMLADFKVPKTASRFINELKTAIEQVGLPAFLRTDYLSDKHNWKETCFIESTDQKYLMKHILKLVETSELGDIERGIPYHFFAAREMLKTKAAFKSFAGEMPIVTEIRFFVRNGKIECYHHYWPKEVFKKKDVNYKALTTVAQIEMDELFEMASFISDNFSGYWSVDFLRTEEGKWFCTDMAIGERSYHQLHNAA